MIITAIRKSVFAKLLLPYILLIILTFTVLGFIISQHLYSVMLDRNEEYARSTLLQINYNLGNNIKQIDEKIKNLYTTEYFDYNLVRYLRDENINSVVDKVEYNNAVNMQLSYLKNSNSNIVGVVLYKPDSKSIYSTSYPGVKATYDFNTYRYIENIKEKNYKLFISPVDSPDYYIKYKRYTVTLARNIIDIDFQIRRAILLVDLDINIFRDIFRQYRNELKGNIIFLDRNSNVYFDLKETMTGKSLSFSNELDIASLAKTGNGNIQREKVLVDDENYYLYILNSEIIEGKILYLISGRDLFLGIDKIKSDILFIIIISVLIASLASIIISKLFTNRIRRMVHSIEHIGEGKFYTRIKEESEDELGQLASTFNNMCVRLENFIDKVYIAELRNKELEIREKAAELKALQMQINPHFLFNTLEAIKINALIGKKDETAEMIRILAGVFRWNVKSGESIVTLEEELIYAMSYLDLQKIRLKDRLEIVYEISEEVKNSKVVKLILQPIIENAVAYGIEGKADKGKVTIIAVKEDDFVIIHVKDDGPGIDIEKLESIRSSIYSVEEPEDSYKIGLRNVQERIRLNFGSQYGIKIFSYPGHGTDVSLILPYKT